MTSSFKPSDTQVAKTAETKKPSFGIESIEPRVLLSTTGDGLRSLTSCDAVGSQDSDIPLFITTHGDVGRVVIRNLPEGAELSHGTVDSTGVLSVDEAELEILSIRPPIGFVGDFDLQVQIESVDGRLIASETVNVWVNGGVEGAPINEGRDVSSEIRETV